MKSAIRSFAHSVPAMINPLGIVSNCWRVQLRAGIRLEDLISEASRRGFQAIELRQGCLGRFENRDLLPDADALARLTEQFPDLQFDVAIAFPYWNARRGVGDELFRAGASAAEAVAGTHAPHLRLVDLETSSDAAHAVDVDTLAQRLGKMCRAVGGMLSVENARQPWARLKDACERARGQSPEVSRSLRICYDPCNLHNAGDQVRPGEETGALSADELSMVHIKQSRQGIAQPVVHEGDVDWSGQIRQLEFIGFQGPVLFEIESSNRVWDRLQDSLDYLLDL